jgi:serine/threonine protein kinase
LAELARRESGGAADDLNDADQATLSALQAELETLAGELRREPPLDDYVEESHCRQATELVERIAHQPDFAPQHPDLERIGPYRVIAKLRQGGMGTVYKAVHTKLNRTVAIKILPPSRTKDAGAIARFEREMTALGGLSHRNIVAATDAGEVDGMHYLVMEYVDGIDLSTLSRRLGPLAPADACEIARQAALGLKEAYDHGIIHRDIKPSNLMLTESGQYGTEPVVKVLDFGLARLAPVHADVDELTISGQIMGTLKYMAPEQCAGARDADVRSDIYSLGATLYRLLSGHPPFTGERFDSPLALMSALSNEEPVRLSSHRSDLPAQLVATVERMMAKNPADRLSSPQEVIDALSPWARGAKLADLLARARGIEDPGEAVTVPARRGAESRLATGVGSRHASRTVFKRALPAVLLVLGVLLGAAAAVVLIPAINPWSTKPPPTATGKDPFQNGRRIAEWVLSQGGSVEIASDERGARAFGPGDDLPQANFDLISASLAGNQSLVGEDLVRFAKHPFLYSLMFNETPLDDDDLGRLGDQPMLKCLYLSQTKITDAGLASLKRSPQLTHLHLQGTAITDAGLRHVAELRNLTQLYLVGCRVSDEGLAHLTGLNKLATLWLEQTDVTAKGVAKTKHAMTARSARTSLDRKSPPPSLRFKMSRIRRTPRLELLPRVPTRGQAKSKATRHEENLMNSVHCGMFF